MAIKDLKIALVHEALTIPGGAETVLRELHILFPDAPIYTSFYRPENFPDFKDATVIPSRLNKWGWLRKRYQMANPLLPYAFEQFDLSAYDLVISSSTSAAKGVLTRPETLHICYCHTPMRWAWMPYLDPRAASSLLRRLAAHYLRLWDVAASTRVDYFVGNSQTIAERIKKFYRREADFIYPPVTMTEKGVTQDDKGYYLTVGRLVAQKRVDLIIKACQQTNVSLKIVGSGPEMAGLKKLARKAKNIEFLGFVSEADKAKLYAQCKAFVFASEEDFGIVPIEAMSYGKPVIAYGKGGASETVIDNKTGLHFDDQTADSLAEALQSFDSNQFEADTIAKHAKQFSPEIFRDTLLAYVTKRANEWPAFKKRHQGTDAASS